MRVFIFLHSWTPPVLWERYWHSSQARWKPVNSDRVRKKRWKEKGGDGMTSMTPGSPHFSVLQVVEGGWPYNQHPYKPSIRCVVELIHNFSLSIDLLPCSCLRDRSWWWFSSGEGGCILAAGEAGSSGGESQPTEMVREKNSQYYTWLETRCPLLFAREWSFLSSSIISQHYCMQSLDVYS